jgi:hypothetical protein
LIEQQNCSNLLTKNRDLETKNQELEVTNENFYLNDRLTRHHLKEQRDAFEKIRRISIKAK